MVDAVAAAADLPAADVRRAFMLSGKLGVTGVAALTGGQAALARVPADARHADQADAGVTGGVAGRSRRRARRGDRRVQVDGARIQVHRQGDEVHVWTRTLREITGSVQELVDLVRALPCESVVLDGETLALTDAGRPGRSRTR